MGRSVDQPPARRRGGVADLFSGRVVARKAVLWSIEGTSLEVERLERPRAWGPLEAHDEGEFNGLLTLDTGDVLLSGHVSWIPDYVDEAIDFFSDLAQSAAGWTGTKTLRTEDDDLILDCTHDGRLVQISACLLDWWDPYSTDSGQYDRKELEAKFTVDPPAVQRFAEEFRAVVRAVVRGGR
jgi:Family of unknown function (DUF6228)